jgi:uncharacterized protein YggE
MTKRDLAARLKTFNPVTDIPVKTHLLIAYILKWNILRLIVYETIKEVSMLENAKMHTSKTVLLQCIVVAIAFSSCLFAQYCGTNLSEKTITVLGEAVIKVQPDVAYFPMDITTAAPLIEDAYDENQIKIKHTIEKLKDLGIKKEWIDVMDAQPYKIDQYGMTETPVFGISNIVLVTLPNINKMKPQDLRQKIFNIAQAVSRTSVSTYTSYSPGGSRISSELSAIGYYGQAPIAVFGVTNYKKLEEEAFLQAIENAKTEAQRLAEVLGVKIKDITYFYQSYPYSSGCGTTYNQKTMLPEGPKSNDAACVKICATVNITFSFE